MIKKTSISYKDIAQVNTLRLKESLINWDFLQAPKDGVTNRQ